MKPIPWLGWINVSLFVMAIIGGVFQAIEQAEAEVAVSGEGSKEIVVTIQDLSLEDEVAAFARGDSLWNEQKREEAVAEYREVVQGVEVSGLEAEAQYKIGLYYITLGDWDQADAAFQQVLEGHPTDVTTTPWAEYSLAWLDIHRNKFQSAIAKFQAVIDKGISKDKELYAYAYYYIGKIYIAFLHDKAKADAAFQKVLEKYPDSKPAKRHFWLK